VIRGGKGICQVLLISLAVAAVFRLAVDDVADDAVRFGFSLFDERHIVAACTVARGHRRRDGMRSGIAAVDPVVFI